MTTKVTIHVNGKYRATVKQDDKLSVEVEGNYNGGSGAMDFWLSHPANSKFEITEAQVQDGDERPA